MEKRDFQASDRSKNIFQPIPGFPGWAMVVVPGGRRKKRPTGYAVLKQERRDDCMVVNLKSNGDIFYVAMISIEYVRPVLDAYQTLYVLFKKDKKRNKQREFTPIGKLWSGDTRTLGMALIHEFSGDTIDPHWYPHHPDGDPTNDLDVIPVNQSVHGLFHKHVRPDTTSEEIERIARRSGNEGFIRYYSSRENWGKYSPKTYDMCQKIHEKDFFGKMSLDSYYALIDAIRNEFYK